MKSLLQDIKECYITKVDHCTLHKHHIFLALRTESKVKNTAVGVGLFHICTTSAKTEFISTKILTGD